MEVLKAIRKNDIKKVDKKLKKGFKPNDQIEEYDSNKKTKIYTLPLNLAAARGHVEIASLLLSHGANVHGKNNDWSPPLHVATFYGHLEMIKLLLSRDVNVNNQDAHGNTPLHIAVERGDYDSVDLLLRGGIDIEIKNSESKAAIDIAKKNGSQTIIKIIEENQRKHLVESIPGMRGRLSTKTIPVFHPKESEESEKDKLRRQLRELECNELEISIKGKQDQLTIVNNNIQELDISIENLQNVIKDSETKLKKQKELQLEKETEKKVIIHEINTLNSKIQAFEGHLPGNNNNDGYECPICYEIPRRPRQVFQCSNGHIYCSECKKKPILKICPQCQVKLSEVGIRNLVLEEIIRDKFPDIS